MTDAGVPALTGGTLGGGDFSSTVIRYGVGGSYDVNPDSSVVVAPVVEMVAWPLNGGYATTTEDGTAAVADMQRAGGVDGDVLHIDLLTRPHG